MEEDNYFNPDISLAEAIAEDADNAASFYPMSEADMIPIPEGDPSGVAQQNITTTITSTASTSSTDTISTITSLQNSTLTSHPPQNPPYTKNTTPSSSVSHINLDPDGCLYKASNTDKLVSCQSMAISRPTRVSNKVSAKRYTRDSYFSDEEVLEEDDNT